MYDAIVLGGGIFGTHVALELRKQRLQVALVEPNELLSGATSVNQGRVHAGYHYPRSAKTAMTAAQHYWKFLIDFAPAISRNYWHHYIIAEGSKVSPSEYESVLKEIGAEFYKIKTPPFLKEERIQQTYQTHEVAFNIEKLRKLIKAQLKWAEVDIYPYRCIEMYNDLTSEVSVRFNKSASIVGRYVFNCTYSSIDKVVKNYRTKLRKEHVEVARLHIAGCNPLMDQDLTLMDGPFWSLMHFPGNPQDMLLTHVKHGRHEVWETPEQQPNIEDISKAPLMIEDMLSYCKGPNVEKLSWVGSMYTTRTLVADTMGDDSRPVIVEYSPDTPRIISILGSKFNSIYDLDDFLKTGEWAR